MTLPQRQIVSVRNPNDGEPLTVQMPEARDMLTALNALVPKEYDNIRIDYIGENPSLVTFRLKGKIISQIEMYYVQDRLTEIVRK